jgi:hypothetical protein
MSILKSKHNGWLSDGTRTPFTGGGGGGPSQTTTQTSNIPEYARPYVENMLGATQSQLFTTSGGSPGTAATYDAEGNVLTPAVSGGPREITGFKPYQAYSQNVGDYFAGPSPLMQQAYQAASQLRTPEQIAAGSRLAEQGGLGFLGTTQPAGMYGQMGAGLGLEAAGAGSQFARQATDPGAVQQYMSPYMQNVVDFQKSQALRDFQIGQPMMQAKAVGQGAFGGNRLALQQSEAQRGLMSQLQGIQATGTQKAFEDAQRQQQFGAQLGLQGMQAGMQGAGIGLQGVGAQQAGFGGATQAGSALGNLGGQQLGAQTGIISLQNQLGLQQQQQEQSKINQAISDYATTQQYPMLQLGLMSNMLRGLPMQAQTTQLYQAQPSVLQQGIGALGAAGSLYGAGAFGRKEGGVVKMAEGGIAGYKYGGAIAEPKLESMADSLSVQQLQQRIKDPALTPGERQVFQEALAAKQQTMARSEGIAAAGGGLFNTMGYAGGGILAFAGEDGSLVEDPQFGGSPGLDADQARMDQLKLQKDKEQYEFLKTASPVAAERLLANNPMLRNAVTPPAPTVAANTKPEVKPAPDVPKTDNQPSRAPSAQAAETSGLSSILAGLRKEGPQGQLGSGYLDKLKGLESGADKRMDKATSLAAARAFAKFGSTAAPGGAGQAAVMALGDYAEGYGKAVESDEKFRMENIKLQSDIDNLRRAEERGDVKLAAELQEKIADRANRLQTAQISASATGRAGDREDKAIQQIMKEKGLGYTEALQLYKRAGLNVENTDIARQKAADAALAANIGYMRFSNSKDPADQQKAAQIRREVYNQYGIGAGGIGGAQTTAVGSGNLVQNKDGSFNYVPK